jgi:hypothetical protein
MSSMESGGGIRTTTQFFMATAVMEVGAGLAFLVAPALAVRLLFGPAETQAAVAIARLAGAALLSLGAACWWARHDEGSASSRGLISGLLIYNAVVVALVLAGTFGSLGPLLWAFAILHGAMALWCARLLQARPMSVRA